MFVLFSRWLVFVQDQYIKRWFIEIRSPVIFWQIIIRKLIFLFKEINNHKLIFTSLLLIKQIFVILVLAYILPGFLLMILDLSKIFFLLFLGFWSSMGQVLLCVLKVVYRSLQQTFLFCNVVHFHDAFNISLTVLNNFLFFRYWDLLYFVIVKKLNVQLF